MKKMNMVGTKIVASDKAGITIIELSFIIPLIIFDNSFRCFINNNNSRNYKNRRDYQNDNFRSGRGGSTIVTRGYPNNSISNNKC